MEINITIKDKHAQDLIDFYIEKQKNIKNQMNLLSAELKEINNYIQDLKRSIQAKNAAMDFIDQSDYSHKWHWTKKIEFAITKAGKPLSTKEIVDILTEYQPEFISERRTAIASVSAILSSKSGTYDQHKSFVKIPSDWGEYTFDVWKEIPMERKERNEDIPQTKRVVIDDSDLPF